MRTVLFQSTFCPILLTLIDAHERFRLRGVVCQNTEVKQLKFKQDHVDAPEALKRVATVFSWGEEG